MKLSKAHLQQIMDEARKQYIAIPSGQFLAGQGDGYIQTPITEGERFALSYLKGCLLTLSVNKLLCDNWEAELVIDLQSQSSDPAVED